MRAGRASAWLCHDFPPNPRDLNIVLERDDRVSRSNNTDPSDFLKKEGPLPASDTIVLGGNIGLSPVNNKFGGHGDGPGSLILGSSPKGNFLKKISVGNEMIVS